MTIKDVGPAAYVAGAWGNKDLLMQEYNSGLPDVMSFWQLVCDAAYHQPIGTIIRINQMTPECWRDVARCGEIIANLGSTKRGA